MNVARARLSREITIKKIHRNDNDLTNMNKKLDETGADTKILKEMLSKQKILLEKISEKLFTTQMGCNYHPQMGCNSYPPQMGWNIFPIKNVESLRNCENDIKNKPKEEVIRYIREIVGKSEISKIFNRIFDDDMLLQINWDGTKKRIAVKDFTLFNYYFFEAVKRTDFGYNQYENEMKQAFRMAKCRFYRRTYKIKASK